MSFHQITDHYFGDIEKTEDPEDSVSLENDEEDTLDQISGDPEEGYVSRDHEDYERRYGRDTAEEEMVAILEDISEESRELGLILGTAENILTHTPQIRKMDEIDQQAPIAILARSISETQYPVEEGVSLEAKDDFVYNEGILSTLTRWAVEGVVTTYKILAYSLKRASLFIARSRKDVDALSARLEKLDKRIKSRKSESNRIRFGKKRLAMLVEDDSVNTTPASAVSTFATQVYGIIGDYADALKAIATKADTDLNKGSDGTIDVAAYEKIISDMLTDLAQKHKGSELLIGNRAIRVDASAKPSKAVTFVEKKPDPKAVAAKFTVMDALSNATVESQRTVLRKGVIEKMEAMIESTSKTFDQASQFTKLSKAKSGDEKDGPEKKETAALGKFLNETHKELIEGILVLSKEVYDLADVALQLLEDSLTVERLVDDREENQVTKNVGRRIGRKTLIVD